MSKEVIGIRVARNGPVQFVEAGDADNIAGDLVVVALSDGESMEREASVVIGKSQMLQAPTGELAGRVLRNV